MSLSRAELYGESIFTSFRSVNGVVPYYQEHLERLLASVNDYYFNQRFRYTDLVNHFIKPLQLEDQFRLSKNHYFRLTFVASKQTALTLRQFSLGDIELILNVGPLPTKLTNIRLQTTPSPYSENACLYKTGSYFQNFYFKQQAMREGFNDVLFTRNGQILEASTSSIFFQNESTIVTPLKNGIFPSISIKLVKSFCESRNYLFQSRKMSLQELRQFEKCFLINSVQLTTPVSAIDDFVFSCENSKVWSSDFEDFVYNGEYREKN